MSKLEKSVEGGDRKLTVCFSTRLAKSHRSGTGLRMDFEISRAFQTGAVLTSLARCPDSAPAGGEIEWSLSLRMISSLRSFL